MRVDPNYVGGLVQSLNDSTLSEQKLTQELSTGLSVTTLADDPVAAGQASFLSSGISQDDSFVQTAATAQSMMQVTDSALGSVVTQLTSALSLAVEGNSGTNDASDLSTLSQQLGSVRDQIVSLANSSYQGSYIFAGSQGNVQPFTVDSSTTPATTTYNGDAQVGSVTTENGQTIQTGLAGSAVFTAPGADVMTALNNLVADFAGGTVGPTATTDIGALQTALSNVSQQRSVLDSSLSRLESASTYAQTDAVNRSAAVSTLVSADPATVATQLSAAETQNQALMSVIATVEKQSLFDEIQ
ncbi:MAG: flagellar hook-associated protein FlgL [Acidobacteriaceae bacterium]|jgi:flagellar hook-associated protein 3 FlgL